VLFLCQQAELSFPWPSVACLFCHNMEVNGQPDASTNPIFILVIRDWLRVCSQTSEGMKLLSAAAE